MEEKIRKVLVMKTYVVLVRNENGSVIWWNTIHARCHTQAALKAGRFMPDCLIEEVAEISIFEAA